MKYNKNYGFGNYGYKSKRVIENKNYFVAIPYIFINSPLDGSEFTDYELALTLTILSYKNMFEINRKLREEDIFLLMYELNIKDIQDEDYLNISFKGDKKIIEYIK